MILIAAGILAALCVADPAPRTALQHYQAGSKAFVERRFDAAIAELRQSLKLDPKQLRVARLLGLSYQLAGNLADAETTFDQATAIAPDDAESWYFLGRVRYVRNFFDRALAALQRAAKLAPGDGRVREGLALTWEALGDAQAAEREYQIAQRAGASPPTVSMNYGAFLLKMNRAAEGEPLLLNAVARMAKSWQPHFELARLYYLTGRGNEAVRELELAIVCGPTEEEARRTHALLANVYSRLGRHEEAQRAAAAAEK